MDIKNIWVTPKLLSFLKSIQCIAVKLTARNRDLTTFEILPKFILRRAKRLFPWWLVGTPYASESELIRLWCVVVVVVVVVIVIVILQSKSKSVSHFEESDKG